MDVDVPTWAKLQEVEGASIVEGAVNTSGDLVLKTKDGVEFNAGSVLRSPQVDVFTADGQWTKPQGAKLVHIKCISGGGGGGGSSQTGGGAARTGGGGGGGGFLELIIPADALPDTSITASVGWGGDPGGSDSDGGDGGPSSFGTFITVPGGKGGMVGGSGQANASGQGGAPGNMFGGAGSTGGDPNTAASVYNVEPALLGGGGGGGGAYSATSVATPGAIGRPTMGGSVLGGSSVAGETPTTGQTRAGAFIGGGGGGGGNTKATAPFVNAGAAGALYGGGGGGASVVEDVSVTMGGPGAPGVVVVITYF